MKRKILVASNLYPSKELPYKGTFVKNFVDSLKEYDPECEIDLCVLKRKNSSKLSLLKEYVKTYASLFKKLMFGKYDLVYCHFITHFAPVFFIASLFRKQKTVYNIHGEDIIPQSRLARMLLKIGEINLKKAFKVVVPSIYFRDFTSEKYPFLTSKIIVSASGGILESFYIKREVPKSSRKITIGYLSRIERGKGWDTFMEAIRIIRSKGYENPVIMVGGGEEINNLKNLRDKNKNLNIEHIGALPPEKIPAILKKMDLFVFPSKLEESLGLVGIEAMAASLPVIGSRIGGLQDYVRDDYNGYYFEPGNVVELSEKIIEYLNLPDDEKSFMMKNTYKTALKYKRETVGRRLFSKLFN